MKIRRCVLFLITLIMTFVFVSCGNSDDSSAAATSSKDPTPVEQLTSDEKAVFDAVIKTKFFNQKEARVLECVKVNENILIGVQGTNKAGGTISKIYMVKNGDLKELGDYDDIFDDDSWKYAAALEKYPNKNTIVSVIYDYVEKATMEHFPSDSVGKINKAIKFHWEEQGLA